MPVRKDKQRIMITIEDNLVEILDDMRKRMFKGVGVTRSEFIKLSIIAFSQALLNSIEESQNNGGKDNN